MKTIYVSLCLAVAMSLCATSARAQSKCDSGRLKAYGKYVACLTGVDSKAAKRGDPPDAVKEGKCDTTFGAKCAQADAKGDCTGNIAGCASLSLSADSCRAATDPSITCANDGGAWLDSACWFLGAAGAECDATCANTGRVYDTATETYAGSGGTLLQCDDVLNAVGASPGLNPIGDLDCTPVGAGLGCGFDTFAMERGRCTLPPTTSSGSSPFAERACGCQ